MYMEEGQKLRGGGVKRGGRQQKFCIKSGRGVKVVELGWDYFSLQE